MSSTITTTEVGTVALRTLAGIVGAGIIAGVTYAAVKAIGGIEAPTAPLLIIHAVGLVVGAMAIGLAFKSRRIVVALGLILTLAAGEAYTLLNTSERELEAREAKQVPARETMERRKTLSVAIAKGEAALAGMSSSHRLEKALESQRSISKMSADTSAQQGCGKYCTKTLADNLAGAQREVDAAREALAAQRKVVETALQSDKAALAAIPVVAALSPLAARTGVADWKLDLTRAGLLTLSANGLGFFLLVFAAHDGRRRVSTVSDSVRTVSEPHGLSFENEKGDRDAKEIDDMKKQLLSIDREIKQVLEALVSSGRPLCNDELKTHLGCEKSESSKRSQKAYAEGLIKRWQEGRFVYAEPTEKGRRLLSLVA